MAFITEQCINETCSLQNGTKSKIDYSNLHMN